MAHNLIIPGVSCRPISISSVTDVPSSLILGYTTHSLIATETCQSLISIMEDLMSLLNVLRLSLHVEAIWTKLFLRGIQVSVNIGVHVDERFLGNCLVKSSWTSVELGGLSGVKVFEMCTVDVAVFVLRFES